MAEVYGTIGILPLKEWDATTQYDLLNLVSYNGSSYVAHTRPSVGTLPTNTAYWQVSAQGGNKATADALGVVKPDGTTIEVDAEGVLSAKRATQTTHGTVRGGTTIKVDTNGGLVARTATQSNIGVVQGGDTVMVGEGGVLNLNTNFQQATALANIIVNEAFETILGKVSKAIAVTMGLDQNALLKNMLTNIDTNDANKVPTSAYIHTLVERIGMGTELTAGANLTTAVNNLNRDLDALETNLEILSVTGSFNTAGFDNRGFEIRRVGHALYINLNAVPKQAGTNLLVAVLEGVSPMSQINYYQYEYDSSHKATFRIVPTSTGTEIYMDTDAINFYAILSCCVLVA